MNKERISMTIDPDLLQRMDAVCEARNEARAAFIERILKATIEAEEQFVADMESPVLRAIARIIAETPGVTKFIASLAGHDTDPDNIERLKGELRKEIAKGKDRQKEKTSKGTKPKEA